MARTTGFKHRALADRELCTVFSDC